MNKLNMPCETSSFPVLVLHVCVHCKPKSITDRVVGSHLDVAWSVLLKPVEFWVNRVILCCHLTLDSTKHNYVPMSYVEFLSELSDIVLPSDSGQYKTQLCPQCFNFQKIREFGESTIIHSFYMDFLFLTLVQVYIFLESVLVKVVMKIAHIFQPGMRKWSIHCKHDELVWDQVFNPQTWDTYSCKRHVESWQVQSWQSSQVLMSWTLLPAFSTVYKIALQIKESLFRFIFMEKCKVWLISLLIKGKN